VTAVRSRRLALDPRVESTTATHRGRRRPHLRADEPEGV